MSLELDWSGVTQGLADRLRERLNGLLSTLELPSYVGPIHIHTLEIGADAPEVEVVHVGDVWREFREAAGGAHRSDSCASTPPISTPRMSMPMRMRTFRQYDSEMPVPVSVPAEVDSSELGDEESVLRWSETDSETGFTDSQCAASELPDSDASAPVLPSLQVHLGVEWLSSTVRLGLTTTLQMHHGDTTVMRLPMSLLMTSFEMLGQVIVALDGEERCIYLTLCEHERVREAGGARTRHKAARILPYLGFDSRVGEPTKHVLENVGKVERFAGDVVRQALEQELVFPNFYTLALPEA